MAGDEDDFDRFLQLHSPQLTAANVPEKYWRTLQEKIENEVFDAGSVFSLLRVEGDEEEHIIVGVTHEDGIKLDSQQHIYLVDHAWTYQLRYARAQLQQVAALRSRMASLMGVEQEEREQAEVVEDILQAMWRFNQTYQFGNVTQDGNDSALEPVWYVMDEFGSQVQHSDDPSVRMVPFYHVPSQVTYSIMWPLKDLELHDEVTRDYAVGYTNEDTRRAKLLPWIEDDLQDISWKQTEFPTEHFQAYCGEETLPEARDERVSLPSDRPIRVYSDMDQVCSFLTDPRFTIVNDKDQADIWWLSDHFKDFRSLSRDHPGKLINQFPCEMILCVKDPLAAVARRVAGGADSSEDTLCSMPSWLPTTYNLQTELTKFVSYYQHRQAKGMDNHWIVKPWNLARGLDTHITKDLDKILRLQESGSKVACKYTEDPVLFRREDVGDVKFDIRYIVMLADTHPVKLYAYKVFWLRFANKPFSLDELDDYEKHFTVMNYQQSTQLKQIHYDEFIPMFEQQYPDYRWQHIEGEIFVMLRELFGAAVSRLPPAGLPSSPQSRAMYAVDLMLYWHTNDKGERVMRPSICELNYSPDCHTACKYHPFFFNDVFSTLFLGDIKDRKVEEL